MLIPDRALDIGNNRKVGAVLWIVAGIFVSLLVGFLYSQTGEFNLVWDDKIYIEDIGVQRSEDFVVQSLTSSFLISQDYYRPLVQLSLLAQWRIFERAGALHLANVGIHLFNALLVLIMAALVASKLGFGRYRHFAALLTSVAYLSHPVLVEPVAWVSGRFDLAVTTFVLMALILERLWTGSQFFKFVSIGVLFFLAALCKEMAVALPLLMPFWLIFWRSNDSKNSSAIFLNGVFDLYSIKIYIVLIFAGFSYLAARYWGMGYLYPDHGIVGSYSVAGALLKFLLIMKSYGWYGLLAAWPFPFVSVFHENIFPLNAFDKFAWISFASLVLLSFALVVAWRRGLKESMFVAMAVVALLPASNIFWPPVDDIVQDRFLTLPLVFFCLFSVFSVFRLALWLGGASRFLVIAISLAWVVFLPFNTRLIVPMWENDLTLWSWAVSQHPESGSLNSNLAGARMRLGLYEGCEELMRRVIEIKPVPEAYMNFGACLTYLGRYSDAENAFMKALDLSISKTQYAINLVNIAVVQIKKGDGKDVVSLLSEAERLMPGYGKTYLVGAHFLDDSKQFSAADAYYEKLSGISSSKEKVKLDEYLKKRRACIEATNAACPTTSAG